MKIEKIEGLTDAEVREKTARGETNDVPNETSRKYSDIFAKNILTPFNALLTVLALAVFAVGGGVANVAFFAILVVNAAIGIFQEIRAKKTLDKVAVLAAPKASVIRGGKIREIPVREIVLGENIVLKTGDQIVADGEIFASEDLEIDESLLTGESDPVVKKLRETVLSGSIVVAGNGVMRADKIGAESYSAKLVTEAKKFNGENSEVQTSINRLLKWISWSLIVMVPVVFVGQLRIRGDWHVSALRSIAAIVGMIPNGLVMLASVAFMLAAVKLSRKKVLVQRMPAVETLARVDTLLLDKTGTLTEGNMRHESIFYDLRNTDFRETSATLPVMRVFATFASRGGSATADALLADFRENFPKVQPQKFTRELAFSSARKFSALEIDGEIWLFGAPEMIFAKDLDDEFYAEIRKRSSEGLRILALAKAEKWPEKMEKNFAKKDEKLSRKNTEITTQDFGKITPIAAATFAEKIRENAAKTLKYFAKQNVDIKVISGDSEATVAAIARTVGLKNVREFDARKLPEIAANFREILDEKNAEKYDKNLREKTKNACENFAKIVDEYNVFGRVKPEQKRQIAEFLQSEKHVVAMTGDGVNDALALKKADLGIAMESGSNATKSVAEIVLLDNDFAKLPDVLAEGRRVIANVERVANLFIVKNVFVAALAVLVTFCGLSYPYLPIQMSLIDFFAIGMPAFFLALAPNSRIYRPGFLRRVLRFVVPTGILIAVIMLLDYYLVYRRGLHLSVIGTSVSIVTMTTILAVLIVLSRPFRFWKIALIFASAIGFFLVLATPLHSAFKYQFSSAMIPATIGMAALGVAVVLAADFAIGKIFAKEM